MAEIVFEHVTKVFPGDVVALDDVSLRIADGEFIALVGPSGCGKSTLLRALAGLEEVTERLDLDRRAGRDRSRAEAPRRRDGLPELRPVPAHERPPEPRVRPQGSAHAEGRDPAAGSTRWPAMLGLEDLLERRPCAALGRSTAASRDGAGDRAQPKAFLMDEPLSNLDAKLRVGMRASLAQLHGRLGVTTVYVTHDQVEAMTLGQRVAVMRDGRILQVDTPQRLYEQPNDLFVAGFIGSPAMNLVEATIDGDEVGFGQFRVPLDPERRPRCGRRARRPRRSARELRGRAFREPRTFPARRRGRGSRGAGLGRACLLPGRAPPVTPRGARGRRRGRRTAGGLGGRAAERPRRSAYSRRASARTLRLVVDPARFHFFDPETGAQPARPDAVYGIDQLTMRTTIGRP